MRLVILAALSSALLAATAQADIGYEREDFQVSCMAGQGQDGNAEVILDEDGNFVVVWEDYDEDLLYAQRFDTNGIAIDTPFAASYNDHGGNRGFGADMNPNGHWATSWVWWMGLSSPYDYRLQTGRYNTSGEFVPPGIDVNVGRAASYIQEAPDIAVNNAGQTVVVWTDFDSARVFMQLINVAGALVGDPVVLDTLYAHAVSVAASENGRVVAGWYRGTPRIRVYDISGGAPAAVGPAVEASTVSISEHGDMDVAMGIDGDICVAMARADSHSVEIARFSIDGTPLGTTNVVSDDDGLSYGASVSVDIGHSGDIAVAWGRDDGDLVQLRLFNSVGVARTDVLNVQDYAWSNDISNTLVSVAVDRHGRTIVAWQSHDNGPAVPAFQRFSSRGARLGPNMRAANFGNDAAYPDVAALWGGAGAALVYEANTTGAIMLESVGYSGSYGATQMNSAGTGANAAVAYEDGIAVVWEDMRGGAGDTSIYVAFPRSGEPTVEMSASNMGAVGHDPDVARDTNRTFVVWAEGNGVTSIQGRVYNQLHQSGSTFRVSHESSRAMRTPAVAATHHGNFVTAWNDYREGTFDALANVFCRLHNEDGDTLSAAIQVNDDDNSASMPRVGADNTGAFVVAWFDTRDGFLQRHAYFQRFDSTGTPIGGNVRVDTNAYSVSSIDLAVFASGAFMVVWEEVEDSVRMVKSREYDPDGALVTERIHNRLPIRTPIAVPAISAASRNGYLVWLNSTRDDITQRDVWAEILVDHTTSASQPSVVRAPRSARSTVSVWPNPFRGHALLSSSAGPLLLYDAAGRLVRRVEPGTFGGDLKAGVYVIGGAACEPLRVVKVQ